MIGGTTISQNGLTYPAYTRGSRRLKPAAWFKRVEAPITREIIAQTGLHTPEISQDGCRSMWDLPGK